MILAAESCIVPIANLLGGNILEAVRTRDRVRIAPQRPPRAREGVWSATEVSSPVVDICVGTPGAVRRQLLPRLHINITITVGFVDVEAATFGTIIRALFCTLFGASHYAHPQDARLSRSAPLPISTRRVFFLVG